MLGIGTNGDEDSPMQTAKQGVEQLLRNLPDDSSYEDIHYHLYVLEKIKRGQQSIAEGHGVRHEQAKERLNRWLKL